MNRIKLIAVPLAISAVAACVFEAGSSDKAPSDLTMSKEALMDKIKGGWAGQTIGCTYGGPIEFKYNATMIPDSIEIPWKERRYYKCMGDVNCVFCGHDHDNDFLAFYCGIALANGRYTGGNTVYNNLPNGARFE